MTQALAPHTETATTREVGDALIAVLEPALNEYGIDHRFLVEPAECPDGVVVVTQYADDGNPVAKFEVQLQVGRIPL